MESASCFFAAASAVYVLSLLWALREGRGTRVWLAVVLVGASLYQILPPALHGILLLACSLVLIGATRRAVQLLPVKSRAVLITGCDSGFGHELAKQLSRMGVTVFAGVLDANGAGAQRLREQSSDKLQILQLDVTDGSQIEAAHRYISTQMADKGLWALVNNAGILQCPADAEIQPITTYRHCMDVNFLAAVKMCQVFLPLLRRSRGRIVNVSSLAGEVPLPMFAAYGASKAALCVFSKTMRLELANWGVQVILIKPTGFKTNIFGSGDDVTRYREQLLAAVAPEVREDYGEAYISSLPSTLTRASQYVAPDLTPVTDAMMDALLSARPKSVYTPGRMAWLLPALQRCCPVAVFDVITMKFLTQVCVCKPAGLGRI